MHLTLLHLSTIVNTSVRLGRVTPTSALPVVDVSVAAGACCSPVTGGVLDVDEATRLARIFKALGDPTRVRLLSLIAAQTDQEACICDLTDPVGLSQPTVSHHMKQLVEAGLVEREQRGRWAYYRVVGETLEALSHALRP
ncbi:ArsR family transcriptional regulator [Ornithinimicrobium humiphilum]|uniref:ArsR family transcriptional regulator n=1 Tax=Ornithinimicrobium humiphilum TaxID=125288 RepID=A0A543K5E4_9MICO|nr:ArsR family transcriptional regulator [Ornithinimicrobium humiphilum]